MKYISAAMSLGGSSRQRLAISVTIQDAHGETRVERGLIDSGAEENCVSQTLAMSCGWTPVDDGIRLATVEGKEVLTYGRHSIDLAATDSKGNTESNRTSLIAVDSMVDGIEFILGYPWLHEVDPLIRWRSRTWEYPPVSRRINVLSAKKFAKEHSTDVWYCLVIQPANAESSTVPLKYKNFRDAFDVQKAGMLPAHHPMEHAINLEPNEKPPWGPLYALSEPELNYLRDYLETSVNKGWIRRSTSPAGAPIMFVPKKDGALRLCVDYRALNKITIKNRTPLPLISETLDRLRRAKIFTKLDLKDAYHRIRIRAGDEWKTAFRTRYGHFEYCVLPFGLCNAPATFQAYINQALIGLVDVTCVVYLDDILIYSEDPSKHDDNVKEVLQRLVDNSLYANEKKCEFDTDTVEFLGFIVGPEGIKMDQERVKSIKEWPEPKSFRDIQVFLGFANFYRRFISKYSGITRPLTDMLKGMEKGKKSGPFFLTEAALNAFTLLKASFTQAPMLRHFDVNLPIRIETDASSWAIAGVLTQLFGEGTSAKWHPIAFYSKKLSDAEQRYDTHDGELMAIVMAFRMWGQYLRGAQYTILVRSDHNNLKYFMTKKKLNGRQARWAEELAEFDFVIEYRTGGSNPADGPSRRPDYIDSEKSLNGMLPTLQAKLASKWYEPMRQSMMSKNGGSIASHLTREKELNIAQGVGLPPMTDELVLKTLQPSMHNQQVGSEPTPARMVGALQRVIAGVLPLMALVSTQPVAGSTECAQCVPRILASQAMDDETAFDAESSTLHTIILALQQADAFVTEKKYVTLQNRSRKAGSADMWSMRDDGSLRYGDALYVPNDAAIRAEIITVHHDNELAGHFGLARTRELIARKYYWGGMRADIKKHIRFCGVCQRTKVRRHKPYGTLVPFPAPSKPWQEITMDFITCLPPSKRYGQIYDSILVIVDRYTKMARYIPCTKTINASGLADLFISHIVKDFGVPMGITTDRGPQFASNFWGSVMFYLKCRRRLSTAFRPQTDGQTERQNQTLEQYLRSYCNYRQDNWTSKLPLAEFSYNNSCHASIGMSPFHACYGYDPELGFNIGDDVVEEGMAPAARERVEAVKEERDLLREKLQEAVEDQRKWYDKKHTNRSFKVGQQVIINAKNIRELRPNKKLSDKYLGPYEVEEIRSSGRAYKLKMPGGSRIFDTFHVSLLEPWYEGADAELERLPVRVNGQEEWEVKSIQAHQETDKGRKYLVRWKGYGPTDDTWEPPENLENAQEIVQEYLDTAPAAIQARSGTGVQRGRVEKRGRRRGRQKRG